MKTIKPDTYAQTKKFICDWTDKKNYSIHYRMLKFYLRHGVIIDEVYNIKSFRQSKWLEKYISFDTQERNKAKNDFEKDFLHVPRGRRVSGIATSLVNEVLVIFQKSCVILRRMQSIQLFIPRWTSCRVKILQQTLKGLSVNSPAPHWFNPPTDHNKYAKY